MSCQDSLNDLRQAPQQEAAVGLEELDSDAFDLSRPTSSLLCGAFFSTRFFAFLPRFFSFFSS
jgi:hypothetical protein